jgi:SWI/SNF-related matrix-associated actin-dependent regulator of chromatin subfamily A3
MTDRGLQDLGSIIKFLQVCNPLDNENYFNRLVIRPLKNGEPGGAELMRAVMTQICIRRTKEVSSMTHED